ncbi:MAG: cell division protein FtsA [Magnetospirillum sp.]|nr:cell division protein FtsA [Magnetospirillum sp.]
MGNGVIAALDVGSTKVCCFIARLQDDGTPRIAGIGHHLARGMRAGAVVDMEELEASIRAAVEAAEEMHGERIRSVVMNASGGQPASANVKVELLTHGHPGAEADLRQMLDHGRAQHETAERELVHAIPVDYTIDGNEGIRDPRGMFGERVGVAIHLVTAATGPLRNLATVVNRCHLDIESRVVSPYASGLACLVEDEKELGVTCIDMGGGTTSLAVFLAGQLVHTEVIAVGGAHVTSDIARGLSTPIAHAERMKTLYGSAIPTPADDREMLKVPLVGEDEDGASNQVARSMLIQIIQPRLEETFELVRTHLQEAGFDKLAGRRVVLTGGASQMQGVRDLAQLVLDKQVRLGRPIAFHGLPEATGGPAFSTCAGLIRYALAHRSAVSRGRRPVREADEGGGWGRIGTWLKNNF